MVFRAFSVETKRPTLRATASARLWRERWANISTTVTNRLSLGNQLWAVAAKAQGLVPFVFPEGLDRLGARLSSRDLLSYVLWDLSVSRAASSSGQYERCALCNTVRQAHVKRLVRERWALNNFYLQFLLNDEARQDSRFTADHDAYFLRKFCLDFSLLISFRAEVMNEECVTATVIWGGKTLSHPLDNHFLKTSVSAEYSGVCSYVRQEFQILQ